jgi:hypothetical protein
MNTELNFSTMSADQKAALLSMLLDNPDFQQELEVKKNAKKEQQKKELERKVKELEDKVKAEKEKQEQSKKHQKELETELNKVRSQISVKEFREFVNPNNPNEVYRTGKYDLWLKELAKAEGIDPHDKNPMAKWVKEKKASSRNNVH